MPLSDGCFTDWMNFCTTSSNVLLWEHCTKTSETKLPPQFSVRSEVTERLPYLCSAVVLLGEERHDGACNDVSRPVGGAARRLQQLGTGPHEFQVRLAEVMFAVWNRDRLIFLCSLSIQEALRTLWNTAASAAQLQT